MDTPLNRLYHLLIEMGQKLGIDSPSISLKEGKIHWDLTINRRLELEQLENCFIITSLIGPLPARNKEDFYLLLMRANFLGQGTAGGILGMDKEENYLTLSSRIPYEVDSKRLEETIETFVNFIDYWKSELDRHNTTSEL